MNFSKSIVAAAAVCGLTQAVNVENMRGNNYVYTTSADALSAIDADELNS